MIRSRALVVVLVVVVLVLASCALGRSDSSPRTTEVGNSAPRDSPSPLAPLVESDPDLQLPEPPPPPPPPPPPQTPCLPETPVEAKNIGHYGYTCLIDPWTWKITNTSLTVVVLEKRSADPNVSFVDTSDSDPYRTTGEEIEALVDRYRQQQLNRYWLQPGDTVRATWASGPGELLYYADPAESAARTITIHLIESALSQRRSINPDDVVGCLEGISDATRDKTGLNEGTWNKVISNGLTAYTCADVANEASDGKLKSRLLEGAQKVWTQVKTLTRPLIVAFL